MKTLLAPVLATLALTGCALSGTSSNSQFGCQAPEGVHCMSASGVYHNSLANNLPGLRESAQERGLAQASLSGRNKLLAAEPSTAHAIDRPLAAAGKRAADPAAGGGIRALPRLARLWIAPWEDSDGDLHDQAYLYMALDSGRWVVGHARDVSRAAHLPTTTLLHGEAMAVPPAAGRSAFNRQLDQLTAPAAGAGER